MATRMVKAGWSNRNNFKLTRAALSTDGREKSNFLQDYIKKCRARVDANLSAYTKHVGKNPSRDFESRFFNDQVLLLDYMFVHRL